MAPIHRHSINTVELYSIKGDERINRYTPAVTIVAACINAETGVGKIMLIPPLPPQTCPPLQYCRVGKGRGREGWNTQLIT